jgi:hypothetical protein
MISAREGEDSQFWELGRDRTSKFRKMKILTGLKEGAMQSIIFGYLGKKCLTALPHLAQGFIPDFEIPVVITWSYKIGNL